MNKTTFASQDLKTVLQNATLPVCVTAPFLLHNAGNNPRHTPFPHFQEIYNSSYFGLSTRNCSFVSICVNGFSHLQCSWTILALRCFNVGVFSLEILGTFEMSHIEAKIFI